MDKYAEKKRDLIINELRNVQIEFTELSIEQTVEFQRNWIEAFTNNNRKTTSHNLWNDLNGKTLEKIYANEKAKNAYKNLYGTEFIIFDDKPSFGFYCFGKNKQLPSWCSIDFDLYIAHKNFNWTYILTHDMPFCGPFLIRK